MTYIEKNKNIQVEKIKIQDIPSILLRPKNISGKLSTVILYHGWSSNKENQKFRGSILANLGYQVIIPDSIHHGERNFLEIDHNNKNSIAKYFWETILKNMDEADSIIDDIIEKYKGNPNKIGVLGHSMGGFTSAGIFTHNKRIKTAIPLNGSFNWARCNEIFAESLESDFILKEGKKVENLDPMKNFDKLIDRPILMLNGEADKLIPVEPQKIFYKELRKLYTNKANIKIIRYPHLGHFVTTNMMEDVLDWLNIHL